MAHHSHAERLRDLDRSGPLTRGQQREAVPLLLRGWSDAVTSEGQRHAAELRERAVWMIFEHAHEYPPQWKAIESIAEKLDIKPRDTAGVGLAGAEVDAGRRPGLTTDERAG